MTETPHPLSDLPAPELGAPRPYIAASEFTLRLLYHSAAHPEALISVHFIGTYAVRWGPPNDERRSELKLSSNPHVVEGSTWLTSLLEEGQLSGSNEYEWMMALRHFCIPFHDSTLEVVACGYTYDVRHSPIHEELPDIARKTLA